MKAAFTAIYLQLSVARHRLQPLGPSGGGGEQGWVVFLGVAAAASAEVWCQPAPRPGTRLPDTLLWQRTSFVVEVEGLVLGCSYQTSVLLAASAAPSRHRGKTPASG